LKLETRASESIINFYF